VIVPPIPRAYRSGLRALAALCLWALPATALGAIREPAEALLADLAEHYPEQVAGGDYRTADGFTFRYELRGGLVYSLSGQGTLSDENVAFLADLIAAGTVGALRLTGTPSVFLNGYKVQEFLDPQAYLDLIELVDAFSSER
jgi:hypothetical protein